MNTKTFKLSKGSSIKEDTNKLKLQFIKEVRDNNFATYREKRNYKKTIDSTNKIAFSPVMTNYDKDTINTWLSNPVAYQTQLRNLSSFLYDTNASYKIVVRYMALMLMFNWTLDIDTIDENPKKVKKNFMEISKYLDLIVDEFEYKKALLSAYKKDIYYGYEIETPDSYFIMELDSYYCKLSSVEDGLYNFKFNFNYFDSRPQLLDTYPEEFRRKYQIYKNRLNDKTKSKLKDISWIEIDSENSFCIKINPDTLYATPPFAGMIGAILDADEYKQLKKDRAENDNDLLIHQKIPMADKEADKFLLSLPIATQFHEQASGSLSDRISLITSPMDLTAVKTEKSRSDNDLVKEAMRDVYSDGGVSQFLFNSGENTSVGLEKSTMTDEEVAFFTLSQIEKHVNRKLKYKYPSIRTNVKFLRMTIFNEESVRDSLLKNAQSGLPVKFDLATSLGMNPNKLLHRAKLENDIFDLNSIFQPMQTAHTLSSDDKGGRPSVSDGKASDSTISNRDNDSDAKKRAKK